MNRQQLAHVLRAACQIAEDQEVLVLGSQAILGTYDEGDLPPEATASMEADIAFLYDEDRMKADTVEGIIGELSAFHAMNGYYAEGVHVSTAVLPDGWRDRLVSWPLLSSHPARPAFLEPHDLAIAKLAAWREKDRTFVRALIEHGLLDRQTLQERAGMMTTQPESLKRRIVQFLDRLNP